MFTLEDALDRWLDAGGGCREVATTVARLASACARLGDLLGQGPGAPAPRDNPPGGMRGRQTHLDAQMHTLIVESLRDTPTATMLSPRLEAPLALSAGAPLAMTVDALEGSAELEANGPVGTIFSLLRVPGGDAVGAYRQPGEAQLAAGFALYGSRTALALTLGDGASIFTLDRASARFVRCQEKVRIPAASRAYAINAANYRYWVPAVRAYIDDCVAGAEGPLGADFDLRWSACVVAEAFRILVCGGLCLCPADTRSGNGQGQLRLVCQANPIARVIEQAGGAATDGTRRILQMAPNSAHQRTPLIFGSCDNVEQVRRYHEDLPFAAHRAPLFGQRGLFRV